MPVLLRVTKCCEGPSTVLPCENCDFFGGGAQNHYVHNVTVCLKCGKDAIVMETDEKQIGDK